MPRYSLGALLLFANSIIFGVVFAAFFRYSTVLVAAVAGFAYASFIWVTMSYVMLPLLDTMLSRTMRERMPLGWFFAHAFFGISLGAAPLFVSRYSKPAGYPAGNHQTEQRAA